MGIATIGPQVCTAPEPAVKRKALLLLVSLAVVGLLAAGCSSPLATQPDPDRELLRILRQCDVPTTLDLGDWRLFSSFSGDEPARFPGTLYAWRGSAILPVPSASVLASLLHATPTPAQARDFYDIVERFQLDEGIATELWKGATKVYDRGIAPREEEPRTWIEVQEQSPGFILVERHAVKFRLSAHVRVRLGPGLYALVP